MKIVLRCGIKTVSLSSWVVVCHKAWPKLTFFLSYPWSCWPEATTEPRTDHSSVFQRLPWRKHSGRGGEWQRADHQALCHSCSALSPHTRGSERALFKKILFLVGNNLQETNDCVPDYILALMVIWSPQANMRTLTSFPDVSLSTFIQERTWRISRRPWVHLVRKRLLISVMGWGHPVLEVFMKHLHTEAFRGPVCSFRAAALGVDRTAQGTPQTRATGLRSREAPQSLLTPFSVFPSNTKLSSLENTSLIVLCSINRENSEQQLKIQWQPNRRMNDLPWRERSLPEEWRQGCQSLQSGSHPKIQDTTQALRGQHLSWLPLFSQKKPLCHVAFE